MSSRIGYILNNIMKCIVLFGLFTVAVAAPKKEYFTTLNEHYDMDSLLANPQKLEVFLDCFLDKGTCSELTESYKKLIPETLKDSCDRCTANQKYMYWRFLQGVKQFYPERYHEFKHHYDPQNEHFDDLEKEISKFLKPVFD